MGNSTTTLAERNHPPHEILEKLWQQKKLPLDTRRIICGGIHRASLKQGHDGVIPPDIMEMIRDPAVPSLHPEDEVRMINAVDNWAFKKKQLRPQYALIILKSAVASLSANHMEMAREVQHRIDAFTS